MFHRAAAFVRELDFIRTHKRRKKKPRGLNHGLNSTGGFRYHGTLLEDLLHEEPAFDGLFCLFPFEPDYFAPLGLESHFIGHPAAFDIQAQKPKSSSGSAPRAAASHASPHRTPRSNNTTPPASPRPAAHSAALCPQVCMISAQ